MTRITIPAGQLASMRAIIPLPDTAIIKSQSQSRSGGMGGAITYTPVSGGTVACRLDPIGNTDQTRLTGAGEATVAEYQLTLPYDAPIEPDYIVTIAGQDYNIIQLDDVHSWNVSRRAKVAEIR